MLLGWNVRFIQESLFSVKIIYLVITDRYDVKIKEQSVEARAWMVAVVVLHRGHAVLLPMLRNKPTVLT